MKKITLSLLLAGFVIGGAILVTSCKKKKSDQDTDASAAVDNSTAENTVNDIINIGSQSVDTHTYTPYRLSAGSGQGGVLDPMSGTVYVSVDTVAKTVTVTFGNGGVPFIGYDGHSRTGTVKFDWSATTNGAFWYRDSGLILNATTPNHDYMVDNNKVEITQHTITNKGRVTNGDLTWNVISNVTITKANNAGTIQWSCNRNNILLNTNAKTYNGDNYPAAFNGYSTPINWYNGILLGFTGSSNGTTSNSNGSTSFTANITSMVIWGSKCSPSTTWHYFHPFVAGSIDFTPSGKTTRTINYGTGTCDATYTITIGSWSGTFSFI